MRHRSTLFAQVVKCACALIRWSEQILLAILGAFLNPSDLDIFEFFEGFSEKFMVFCI